MADETKLSMEISQFLIGSIHVMVPFTFVLALCSYLRVYMDTYVIFLLDVLSSISFIYSVVVTADATNVAMTAKRNSSEIANNADRPARRGMVLPFQPLSLTFNHINYYVDMPAVSVYIFAMSSKHFSLAKQHKTSSWLLITKSFIARIGL